MYRIVSYRIPVTIVRTHRQSTCPIGNFLMRLSHFIRNTSILIARIGLPVASGKLRTSWRSTRTSFRTERIPRMRTTKLIHKVGNDAMEMNVIVKTAISQINEIATRNGHFIRVQFGLKINMETVLLLVRDSNQIHVVKS
jgi:hypothetical protein